MAQKNKKTEEFISLTAEALKVVSYADYFTQTPLFTSLADQECGRRTRLTDLTLDGVQRKRARRRPASSRSRRLPFESSVEVDRRQRALPASISSGLGERARRKRMCIEPEAGQADDRGGDGDGDGALPFDYWQGDVGQCGAARLLSCAPSWRTARACRRKSALQLKKWGVPGEGGGYEGCDKNTVIRQTAAALYACIRRYAFEREECDISAPVEAGERRQAR